MAAETVPEVVKLHIDTFSGYRHIGIGRAYVRAFLEWFRQADRSIALVAINSYGQVIGYVVGAPVGYGRAMNRDLLWVATKGMILRPWIFFSGQFRRVIMSRLGIVFGYSFVSDTEPNLSEPTMSLVSIAVSPSERGNRVGRHLIQAFEEKSRQLGMQSMRLSVFPSNRVARRFYECSGWQSFSGPLRETGEMFYLRVLSRRGSKS